MGATGRPSWKGAPSQPALTPEERTLLSSSVWSNSFDVDTFERFLQSTGMGAANRKNCVRVARRLKDPLQCLQYKRSTLHGKPAAKHFTDFWLGETITVATDFHVLKKQAFVWCPYEDDAGNGWAVNHPFNKLMDFQRHILTQLKESGHVQSTNQGCISRIIPACSASPPPLRKRPVSPSLLHQPPRLAPISKKQKPSHERDPTMYKPPSAGTQLTRYAGICVPLKKYMKSAWGKANKSHWKVIRRWCQTPEGRKYLREDAKLDPDSVHLDHIQDKNSTPVHHAFNCYFMPGGPNSHFKDNSSAEKMAYVGDNAAKISKTFVTWYIEMSTGVDCFKFDVGKATLR